MEDETYLLKQKIQDLSNELANLKLSLQATDTKAVEALRLAGDNAGIAFVIAIVCAIWAQNTSRSGVAWFFFGLLLPIIAPFVVMYKNRKVENLNRPLY